ncbi:MAG TPA: tRNA preQ1(34) S-adenosylmethionine ribosyltransferase-isomerase QueA [Chthoniobacterales bacterium]|jgi:S-adenosylmethionine:tRNA ribosyltransferase-isomerase|nr:tRNA preQ1(34) S-adenosylmethionine ribosyltransferase-isomerase QueA [Chthoniobacterales bacterium]
MSVRTADYDYELSEDLIALYPAPRRDESRMMLLDRREQRVSHLHFGDLIDLVEPGELLVLNDTKVVPARIRFPDRNAELLLLERVDPLTWRCLVRPGKWFQEGRTFTIQGLSSKVLEILSEGYRLIRFDSAINPEQVGELALPPYIARKEEAIDRERYQTVYASRPGAIAAPTAGLHFTSDMLDRLPHEFITLHVGAGTFKPVKDKNVTDHRMHFEEFEVSKNAAANISAARKILAVGTTTVRTIESLMRQFGEIRPGKSRTDMFIYPPFEFQRVDSLLTNFHLPRSTLLMLAAAFAGREFVLEAYREAVKERYRFFSYGDCMLVR